MIRQILQVTASTPKEPPKPFVSSLTLNHSDLMNRGNSGFGFDLFVPVSEWLVVALALPVIQLLQTVFRRGA